MTLLRTEEAAALLGLTDGGFRASMAYARNQQGIELRAPREQWIDGRTPTYDQAKLLAWQAKRPSALRRAAGS